MKLASSPAPLVHEGIDMDESEEIVMAEEIPYGNSNSSVVIDMVRPRKQIQQVPGLFRSSKAQDAYDPIIVSIGPYWYGLRVGTHAEDFKQHPLDVFLSGTNNHDLFLINENNLELDSFHFRGGVVVLSQRESFFYWKILERIQEIRDCYQDKLGQFDEELAWVILRDACFFIFHLQCLTNATPSWTTQFTTYYAHFGPARLKAINRDLLLLGNQIPFWVMELLLSLHSDQGKSMWKQMVHKFINNVLFEGERAQVYDDKGLDLDKHHEAYSLLDAYYPAIKLPFPVGYDVISSNEEISIRNVLKSEPYRFRSITNLMAKGIVIKKSENAISFTYHIFSGHLNLPPLVFRTNFFQLYTNLLAYEVTEAGNNKYLVSTYVNFLKTLIECPNDVKILREEGIMVNDMISDEEVVNGIKNLDTLGFDNVGIFAAVRTSIERHCSRKRKTWAAELYHTQLKNPWTVTALVAAFVLLCLTFLQTVFTILST